MGFLERILWIDPTGRVIEALILRSLNFFQVSSRFILVSPYMAEVASGIGTYKSGLHIATELHVVSTLLSSNRSKDKNIMLCTTLTHSP